MDIYNKSQFEISQEIEREIQQDYNNFIDKNLPINSVFRTSNDYSSFGIAANTPGMSLAEAQILDALLKGK